MNRSPLNYERDEALRDAVAGRLPKCISLMRSLFFWGWYGAIAMIAVFYLQEIFDLHSKLSLVLTAFAAIAIFSLPLTGMVIGIVTVVQVRTIPRPWVLWMLLLLVAGAFDLLIMGFAGLL